MGGNIYKEENSDYRGAITPLAAAVLTQALCNTTLPYALKLANQGFVKVIKGDGALAKGVNTFNGCLTNEPVSRALGIPYTPLDRVMNG